jgi:hypothetical protein
VYGANPKQEKPERMIDNRKVWSTTADSQSFGVARATNEPSHIHIPRPSRLARRADGNRPMPADLIATDGECGQAQVSRRAA